MNWVQSVSKSLPLIMGNQESAVEAPVEPDKKPTECGEICVVLMTKLEGRTILNNIIPKQCIYGIDVDVTTKYILKEVNKNWELQDNKGIVLADSTTLFGTYDLFDPNLIEFEVFTCE